jgi:hypothetical protein
MSLYSITTGMLKERTANEEDMCKTFCTFHNCQPEDLCMEMRELPDGSTEYWLTAPGNPSVLMVRALPLEFITEGDSVVVKQIFERREPKTWQEHLIPPNTLKVTL